MEMSKTLDLMVQDNMHDYSPDYVARAYRVSRLLELPHMFFDKIVVEGLDNLNCDRQKYYSCNHKSRADSPSLWHAFLDNHLELPRFGAGRSIRIPSFLKLGIFDFGRHGTFWFDRSSSEDVNFAEKTTRLMTVNGVINRVLDEGDDCFMFGWGTRTKNDEVSGCQKKTPYKILIPFKGEVRDLDVVPVAIDYDKVIEDCFLSWIKPGNRNGKFVDKVRYFGKDVSAFAWWVMTRSVGLRHGNNCYINFGEPINLRDFCYGLDRRTAWRDLMEEVGSQVKRLYGEIQVIKKQKK